MLAQEYYNRCNEEDRKLIELYLLFVHDISDDNALISNQFKIKFKENHNKVECETSSVI